MNTILWTLALLGSGFLVLVSVFALAVSVIKPEFGPLTAFWMECGSISCVLMFGEIAMHAPSTWAR